MTNIPLNPITDQRYSEFIAKHSQATVFHTPEWIKVLSETYRFKPFAFAVTENDTVTGVVPFCETRSITGSKRLVSLPYSDFCEPLLENRENLESIIKIIAEEYPKTGYIDVRGGSSLLKGEVAGQAIFTHDIDCTPDEETLFNSFKPALQRNIKKAQREGLECTIDTSHAAVRQFYQLNCFTRRDHGLPPQPWVFFENIWKFLIHSSKGFIATITQNGCLVAATLFLIFNGKAYFKFGASLKKHLSLRPNDFALWNSILYCKTLCCKVVNLGRTEPEHEGLLQFKRGWNADESEIKYYRYLPSLQKYTKFTSPVSCKICPLFFSRMPMAFLKPIGNYIHQFAG